MHASRGATLAVVVVLLATGLTGCGDDAVDPDAAAKAAQVRDEARSVGLSDDVADLLGRVAIGETATYEVTYSGPVADSTLVVSNRFPDRRVDLVVGDVVVESRLLLDGDAHTCVASSEGGPVDTCEPVDAFVDPPGVLAADALDTLAAALAAQAESYTLEVRERSLAGTTASCLLTTVSRTTRQKKKKVPVQVRGSVCVAPSGAVLSLDHAGLRLEALSYESEVDTARFTLPGTAD